MDDDWQLARTTHYEGPFRPGAGVGATAFFTSTLLVRLPVQQPSLAVCTVVMPLSVYASTTSLLYRSWRQEDDWNP
jgi:hypothetical protein